MNLRDVPILGRIINAASPTAMVKVRSAFEQIVVSDARQRWASQKVRHYTPDRIEAVLSGAFAGSLVFQWELYDLMEATWPRLTKNLNEIKDAVTYMDWTIQPWAPSEGKPSESAKRKAALVEELLWHMQPHIDADENDFGLTLRDLMDAWGKGVSVLEVDWEDRQTAIGPAIAPRCTRWIHPRFYGYPMDDTRLRLNAIEIASTEGCYGQPIPAAVQSQQWLEFPPDKFLVGIAKARTGHPIGAALLRPLAFWWAVSNFSASWMLNHAQLFGVPLRWATYDPAMPNIKEIVSDMLENMGSAGWAAVPTGTQLQIVEAVKSAADNPNIHSINLANEICDILILRQTLTTSAGDKGSQALGTVHKEVRGDVISTAGGWVANIINTQLLPSILRLNFGDDTECPWLQDQEEEGKDESAMSARDKTLADMGLTFPEQWFRERYGVPPVAAGEAVVGGRAPQPVGLGGQRTEDRGQMAESGKRKAEIGKQMPDGGKPVQAKDATDKLTDNVIESLTGVEARWLGAVKPFFQKLVATAANEKVTDAEFERVLVQARGQFPELFGKLDKDALAEALEGAMGAACVNGALEGAMRRNTR